VRRSASSGECNADYLPDGHASTIRAAVGFVTIAASSKHARNFYKESRQADKVCRRCGSDRRGRLRATARTSLPSSTRNTTWSLTIEGLAAFPSDDTLLSARGKYTSIDVPSTDRPVICTVPPDCLATPSTMLRPRPDPLPISLVVKKGSNAFARTSSLMPVPVSLTDTTAYSPAGKSAGRSTPLSVALLVSIVNVPPRGMASRALMARLSKTSSLIRIDQGRPQSRLSARLKADHGSDRCLQQIAHVCDNVIEVDGFRQKRLFAREREELASEPFAAPDRLSGVAQQLQRAGFLGPALEHPHLEIAEDCRARHRP
jgi:hypothetical protein